MLEPPGRRGAHAAGRRPDRHASSRRTAAWPARRRGGVRRRSTTGSSIMSQHAQRARLRRGHPVPRRADPVAGEPRGRHGLRLHARGTKLAKLVEAQTPTGRSRWSASSPASATCASWSASTSPAPMQLAFADVLKHWEARFHRITLEDRNLPAIAEKRVLRPRSEARRARSGRRRFEQAAAPCGRTCWTRCSTSTADRRHVPQGLPVQPGAGADAGRRLVGAAARADGAEADAAAPGGPARRAASSATSIPVGDLWDVIAERRRAVHRRHAHPLRQRQAALTTRSCCRCWSGSTAVMDRPAGTAGGRDAGAQRFATTRACSRRCCSRRWCPRWSRSRH